MYLNKSRKYGGICQISIENAALCWPADSPLVGSCNIKIQTNDVYVMCKNLLNHKTLNSWIFYGAKSTTLNQWLKNIGS